MKIRIEPWNELVVHEVLELKFDEWIQQIISGAKYSGGGIPSMFWANGIIFVALPFPDSETVIQEKLKGIIHYSSVTFAIKEKFEKQIIKESVTINFADVSNNEIFGELVATLKAQSKFKTS